MRYLPFLLALASAGCGPLLDGDPTAQAEDDTSGTGDHRETTSTTASAPVTTATTGATAQPPATTAPPVTSEVTTDGPGSSGGSTGYDGSSGSTGYGASSGSSSGDFTGAVRPGPNGAECGNDAHCLSGHCFFAGILGGICGECSSDADCEFGCSLPDFAVGEGSTCGDGTFGAGCESDAACVDLECAPVLEALEASTCGECDADNDCVPGEVCNLDLDLGTPGGTWSCVPTASLPLGAFCAQDGSGDLACASGYCTPADFLGLFDVGVCSECEVNDDCAGGQSCIAPDLVDEWSFEPAVCN